jgi:hypothetical protein
MKDFWVIWFYVANHGKIKLSARDAAHAVDQLYCCFSADFKVQGTILVFDHEPTLVIHREKETKF